MRNCGPLQINNFQFRILLNHSQEVSIPHPVVEEVVVSKGTWVSLVKVPEKSDSELGVSQ